MYGVGFWNKVCCFFIKCWQSIRNYFSIDARDELGDVFKVLHQVAPNEIPKTKLIEYQEIESKIEKCIPVSSINDISRRSGTQLEEAPQALSGSNLSQRENRLNQSRDINPNHPQAEGFFTNLCCNNRQRGIDEGEVFRGS